jgi:hypothetical protein
MLRQRLGLGLGDRRKALLENRGDAGVDLLPPAFEQALVGNILNQGVPRCVAALLHNIGNVRFSPNSDQTTDIAGYLKRAH